jgi:hypothetical protein
MVEAVSDIVIAPCVGRYLYMQLVPSSPFFRGLGRRLFLRPSSKIGRRNVAFWQILLQKYFARPSA